MIIHIQKRENPFVQIDKRGLEDKRLSFKARGVLAYLLSKPPKWRVMIQDLVNKSDKDGEAAVRSALKELMKAGYMEFKQPQKENGQFDNGIYIVYEVPRGGFPHADKPNAENPTYSDIDSSDNDLSDNDSSSDDEQKGAHDDQVHSDGFNGKPDSGLFHGEGSGCRNDAARGNDGDHSAESAAICPAVHSVVQGTAEHDDQKMRGDDDGMPARSTHLDTDIAVDSADDIYSIHDDSSGSGTIDARRDETAEYDGKVNAPVPAVVSNDEQGGGDDGNSNLNMAFDIHGSFSGFDSDGQKVNTNVPTSAAVSSDEEEGGVAERKADTTEAGGGLVVEEGRLPTKGGGEIVPVSSIREPVKTGGRVGGKGLEGDAKNDETNRNTRHDDGIGGLGGAKKKSIPASNTDDVVAPVVPDDRGSKPSRKKVNNGLLPDTIFSRMAFGRLQANARAIGRRGPKRFKTLEQKKTFDEAAAKLGETEFKNALETALKRGINSVDRLTNWIAKWQKGAKRGAYQGNSSGRKQAARNDPSYRVATDKEAARILAQIRADATV